MGASLCAVVVMALGAPSLTPRVKLVHCGRSTGHLPCLTSFLDSCRGFDELLSSAWADNPGELRPWSRGAPHWGARRLYKPRSEDIRRVPVTRASPNGIFVTPVGMSRGDNLVSKWDKSLV
jgi:hypothetical protein